MALPVLLPPAFSQARGRAPEVLLGHDGSAEAAEFLEALEEHDLGHARLMSPKGVASQVEAAPCAVWALLPGPGGAREVALGDWALQAPAIGSSSEWETWDYLQSLLGERWWGAYAWEYWRFLQPSEPVAVLEPTGEGWWKLPEKSAQLVSALRDDGFLVLDDFLPQGLAAQLSSRARREREQMMSGVLSSGASFARGDAVLWVNTHDPATGWANFKPKDGQSSKSIPELKEVLEHIDALVADVLAPQLEALQCIRTRSHAMLTCYPAAEGELVDAEGTAWAGPSGAKGYLRHVDNEREKDHCGRILTTILYLNPEWQATDGGALRLFEVEPPLAVRAEVLPLQNRLVAFWADAVPHEVLAPKRDRFACTFWYLDRDVDPSSVPFESAPAMRAAAAAGSAFLD